MRPPAATAGLALLLAVGVGATTGGLPLGRPTQLLRPPYVAEVPGRLQAAFCVLAVGGVVAAVVAFRRLAAPPAGSLVGLGLLAAVGAAAATWGGLYAAAVTNPIPVFDWLFYAVPAALGGLLSRGRAQEPLVPALLAAVPVAAVNTLGWSVVDGPDAGLRMVPFSGIGLLLGLGVAMAVGQRGPTAEPGRGTPG